MLETRAPRRHARARRPAREGQRLEKLRLDTRTPARGACDPHGKIDPSPPFHELTSAAAPIIPLRSLSGTWPGDTIPTPGSRVGRRFSSGTFAEVLSCGKR